jgi:hypothetical protein
MHGVFFVLIVIAVSGLAIAAMLFVRKRAPDGSYFNDGDRASGVFGVLATGFSVLLGFIVFLAFTSYDESRAGAETEARTVGQQVETAQLFHKPVANELTGELLCYARSVVATEWDQMEDGSIGEHVNPWTIELFRTIDAVEPQTAQDQAAYGKWLDQTTDRESARQDRIHGAVGVIPTPLWIVLFFISIVIFCYMLFFADSGERKLVQAMLMGSVVSVMAALLLLLFILNNPFRPGLGALRPVAMQRAQIILDEEVQVLGFADVLPCDDHGIKR